MYNEAIKRQFISEYTHATSVESVLRRIFEVVAPDEERLGMDLCAMTVEQLQPIVDKIGGQSYGSRCTFTSSLRAYGKWCLQRHLNGARIDLTAIKLGGLESVAMNMVAGPMDLQIVLDTYLSPESDRTVDNVVRAYFWLVFAGVRREDAVQLTRENIDFAESCVHVGHLSYPIYPQAVSSLRNVIELSSFRYVHPMYEPVQKNRYPGDKILRMIKGDAEHAAIEMEFIRKRSKSGVKDGRKFSYITLRKSGIFYRYYVLERERVPIPFGEATLMYFDRDTISDRKKLGAATRALRRDYNLWKDAFRV
jgi:hypothetical protein